MKRLLSKTEFKTLSDTIKLIKSAYPSVIYVSRAEDGLALFTNAKGVNPAFKYSHFTGMNKLLPPEMFESLIDVEVTYNAIKDKMDTIEVLENGTIIADVGNSKPYAIGHKASSIQTSNIMGMSLEGFKMYYSILSAEDNLDYDITEYDCTEEDITRLINYETVTFRPEPESSLGLILTCKCFPNIKKCKGITIQWLSKSDEDRFYFIVYSKYMDKNQAGFVMTGEALRC